MLLKRPIQQVFVQLTSSLEQLTDEQYTAPCQTLSRASIGEHVRHIIELFQCLAIAYDTGSVNYDNRKRDHAIETRRDLAIDNLKNIYLQLDRPNVEIMMEVEDHENGVRTSIPSNYYREIAYNLEHTIHHMALVRVGITEVSSLVLPVNFGVAYSTIKHREQCAQ